MPAHRPPALDLGVEIRVVAQADGYCMHTAGAAVEVPACTQERGV